MLGDSRDATAYDQAVLPYGDMWRHHRRLMHNVVGSQVVRSHQPIQDNEIKILIGDQLDRPDYYVKAIQRYSVSVVSSVRFGRRIDKMDDTVAKVALKFMEGVDMAIPGLFIMESIPFLLNLPKIVYPLAMTMKDSSAQLKAFFTALAHEGAFESLLPNFSTSLIHEQKESNLSDNEIAFLTGNLIGGGVDTTASTTLSFVFAMCAFPDVQRKAFEEIDRVVGQSRMPDWKDKETCLTVQQLSAKVFVGERERLEYPSQRARPPEPDQFNTYRFLEERRPFPNKKGHSAFGWGRRQCSGQPLAEQGLFLTFARLIWSFEMRPALMQDLCALIATIKTGKPEPSANVLVQGREEKLDIFVFSDSENMRPEPFGVRFIPRNEKRAETIYHELKAAREYLAPLKTVECCKAAFCVVLDPRTLPMVEHMTPDDV
ncbi:hypothetical protein N7488_012289 [Penicillium malachiteum]|nr:hypothetical protein N7488_012289 [Penicillium malachiteum]